MSNLHKISKPIVLCGFMATGKSSIGRLLSKKLDLPYMDTDEMIVSRANMSIPDIFSKYGENYFRDLEHEVANDISGYDPCVISTGGGMLTYERNANLLMNRTTIICLTRDFDILYSILSSDTSRPMVIHKTKDEIKTMYDNRMLIYKKYASILVDNSSTPDECISIILSQLEVS